MIRDEEPGASAPTAGERNSLQSYLRLTRGPIFQHCLTKLRSKRQLLWVAFEETKFVMICRNARGLDLIPPTC